MPNATLNDKHSPAQSPSRRRLVTQHTNVRPHNFNRRVKTPISFAVQRLSDSSQTLTRVYAIHKTHTPRTRRCLSHTLILNHI
ncbi:hypothetical protein PsYK624_000940 [Phanerochaete sordida]|uniref:Uncharacterized protein n=1 Tax=Phanerochaete sordida TaxID=48140 RepID=A0A9P3FX75_9APHY|nr:hypothetical protein PsYK624_000940 [Phanerochaete sordida]